MAIKDGESGVINPEQLYTREAFLARLGIRNATLRSARRAGLRVSYKHKHIYILGRDWIEYVLRTPDRAADALACEG